MRCKACNVELTDTEATYRDQQDYLDLCSYCLVKGSDTTPMEVEYVKEYSDRPRDDYDS